MKKLLFFALAIMTLSTEASAEPLTATLETSKGTITLELTPDKTPLTVASFVNLIQRGYYDNLTFHRVEPGFVIQGGDPVGNGTGGPGYKFKNEQDPSLTHNREGTLAMANAGPNTNGSQFYITLAPTPFLDGNYTVFGYVKSGMEAVKGIRVGDKILKATVTGDTAPLFSKVKSDLDNWNKILDKSYPRK